MKRQLLLTDLHLGVKNGSMAWLKSQQLFLNELLKTPDIEEVVCLGDVFDTRVGVQTHVATFAREWFSKWKVPVVIIAGNHDYYSPDTDKYCALDNVLAGIPGLTIVSHDILVRNYQVFIPWYDQEREGITELSKKYKGNIIFTHADIGMSRCKLYTPTFSGHIHFPTIEPGRNCYSLGSCFPLTFADCAVRCAYILESEGPKVLNLIPIKNKVSIQFHRYYEWPEDLDEIPTQDYIELYLRRDAIPEDGEVALGKWKSRYPNLTIYKVSGDVDTTEGIDMTKNMEEIISGMIPEDYKDEFEQVRAKSL